MILKIFSLDNKSAGEALLTIKGFFNNTILVGQYTIFIEITAVLKNFITPNDSESSLNEEKYIAKKNLMPAIFKVTSSG